MKKEVPGICLLLVTFDYDEAAGVVLPTSNNYFAFDPSEVYGSPRVPYYTPDSAAGDILPVTSLAGGLLQVTIPALHVYGVVVLQEE